MGAPFRMAQFTGDRPRNAGRREPCMLSAPFGGIERILAGISFRK